MTLFLFLLTALLLFVCNTFCSILKVYNSNDSSSTDFTTYEIPTPHFYLGNLDFPFTGQVVFGKGCSAADSISDQQTNSSQTKLILFVEYNADDDSCFRLAHVFSCQKKSWCGGVLVQDVFYSPVGFRVYSLFDKHRSRSEYKVPLVESNFEDFDFFKDLIKSAQKKGNYYSVTLINDPNPWQEAFDSPALLVFFRILLPLWSSACFLLTIRILYSQSATGKSNRGQHKSFRQLCFGLNLKQVCLLFHALTHIGRLGVAIDPFPSQHIVPYIVFQVFVAISLSFEMATHLLLSFVIRELTLANRTINIGQKIAYAYGPVVLLISAAFANAGLEGTLTNPPELPFLYIMIFFYCVVNICLGVWYFVQGYRFLKKCSAYEKSVQKENRARVTLTQTSLFNSVGMILFGITMIFFSLRVVFGTPWGLFSVYVITVTIVQFISVFEILLFGGVVVDFRRTKRFFYFLSTGTKSRSKSFDTKDRFPLA
eukprot:c21511_g4_i2.p1 GENE.c21511_g4_i2~~c21511_g4_i2.p1  ORF type:complete len:493 (-),score=108.32 c21511_g4_i2:101-1549(-)